MQRTIVPLFIALTLVSGCTSGASPVGQRVTVVGTGPEELLKLRAGPGLNYNIILGLPDGTSLKQHNCVTELGQLWCRVSLADAPRIDGYVSADYLSSR